MPFRRKGFSAGRMRSLQPIINSEKNVVPNITAGAAGVQVNVIIAQSVNSADNTVANEVTRRSHIKAIWLELTARQSEAKAAGISTLVDIYIAKNPGDNLTLPVPGTIGTSNEKKFIFKTWRTVVGLHTEGFPSYRWAGWIKVPKRYQRMGTDDKFQLSFKFTGVNGLICTNFIYKWYS